MALQRQGSGTWQVGIPASSNGDHKVIGIQRPLPGHSRMYDGGRSDSGGVRSGSGSKNPLRLVKGKRSPHTGRFIPCSIACVLVVCLVGVLASFIISEAISRTFTGSRSSSPGDDDIFGKLDHLQFMRTRSEYTGEQGVDVQFDKTSGTDNSGSAAFDGFDDGGSHNEVEVDGNQDNLKQIDDESVTSKGSSGQDVQRKPESGSLYNERGRDELVEIAAHYEDDPVKDGAKDGTTDQDRQKDGSDIKTLDKLQPDLDEYDDNGDETPAVEGIEKSGDAREGDQAVVEDLEDTLEVSKVTKQESESTSEMTEKAGTHTAAQDVKVEKRDESQKSGQKVSKTKKKRHTATAPCEIDFKGSTERLQEPQDDTTFGKFSLSYVETEERPLGDTDWAPKFGGHQTLAEREESFHAKNQTIHCGFVKAPEGEPLTGFELSEDDKVYLSTCHIAVSSCIFGAWDHLRTPTNKKMTSSSKAKVCFVMFVDQKSLDVIQQEERQKPNDKGNLGLWKIVLIKNLPYQDGRRNGKVPKFLTHRLFPNARYSIWLDSKLRLHADPLLILERFLWRGKHEYAISNHYDRHCVWEEVAQNKKLNKFNHSIIDEQFQFYQRDGLSRFNRADPHRLLPSHVPEGSFIVRAHTPMSNLFSCLWFNEVERFTPRDQLSFAYTYIKLARVNPTKRFRFNMFKDCERKAMAKLYHHRLDAGSAVTNV